MSNKVEATYGPYTRKTPNVYADPNPSLVLALCVAYDRLYGYDTDGAHYARLKATLEEYTERKPGDGDMERVLKGIEEYHRLERDRPILSVEWGEVYPHDCDYGPTLTAALETEADDINDAIGGLL